MNTSITALLMEVGSSVSVYQVNIAESTVCILK